MTPLQFNCHLGWIPGGWQGGIWVGTKENQGFEPYNPPHAALKGFTTFTLSLSRTQINGWKATCPLEGLELGSWERFPPQILNPCQHTDWEENQNPENPSSKACAELICWQGWKMNPHGN